MSEEIKEETTPTIESYEQLIESDTANEWLESKVGTQLFQESEVVPIKLIDAGWGSSGHYSKEVLQRDGSNAFPAGTHMYINHPTATERATRPERDVRNLAAVTVESAKWDDYGKDGAGLYAQAEVFSSHVPFIKERANHIGVSIVADGVVESGEAEGRKGRIIKSIKRGYSADFVTRAGRGGKVLLENADIGDMPIRETIILGGDLEMAEINEANQAELSRLLAENEALTVENTQLKSALVMAEGKGIVSNTLAEFSLPETVVGLVTSQAVAALPMTESGKLDAVKLAGDVRNLAEAIKADIKPQSRSVVVGSGFQPAPPHKTLEELKAESAKFLMRENGVNEEAALFAVNGA